VTRGATADSRIIRNPAFWWFFSGMTTSVFGDTLTRLAIPLIVYRETRSPVSLGITLALTYLPYALFGLLAGVVVDRYDRWRVLMVANLLQFLVMLSLLTFHAFGTLTIAYVYVAVFLMATVGIPEAAATPVVLNEVVPRGDLLRANRWSNGGAAVSEAAGPVVGAVLLASAGAGTLLLVDTVTFLLVIVALNMARRSSRSSSHHAPDEDRAAAGPSDRAADFSSAGAASHTLPNAAARRSRWRNLRHDLVLGLLAVWRDPVLRAISALIVVVNVFAPTLQAQFLVYAVDTLQLPESASGLLLSAGAVGAVVALPLIGRVRRGGGGFAGLLTGAFVVQGAAIVALALTRSPSLGLLLWMVSSGAGTVQRTLMTTLRQHIVAPAIMGRVFAASMTLAWSIIPLGVLLGGVGTRELGIKWIFMMCGAATIASALVFHRFASSRIRSLAGAYDL
jgi:MFS family permease